MPEGKLRAEATEAAESPSESREAEELLGSREWAASKNLSLERLASGGLPCTLL